MLIRRVGLFLCATGMLAALASCGGEDLGGGIGEFTTVNASAVAETPRLESDIITGNTCTAGASTGGTVDSDLVNVNVTSTPQFSTGALNLKISKITVSYFPLTVNSVTPPALNAFTVFTGFTVTPGSSLAVPVTVLPDSYKIALLDHATQSLAACGATVYEYVARVTMEVSEIGGSGKVRTVTTDLNLAVADRQ